MEVVLLPGTVIVLTDSSDFVKLNHCSLFFTFFRHRSAKTEAEMAVKFSFTLVDSVSTFKPLFLLKKVTLLIVLLTVLPKLMLLLCMRAETHKMYGRQVFQYCLSLSFFCLFYIIGNPM